MDIRGCPYRSSSLSTLLNKWKIGRSSGLGVGVCNAVPRSVSWSMYSIRINEPRRNGLSFLDLQCEMNSTEIEVCSWIYQVTATSFLTFSSGNMVARGSGKRVNADTHPRVSYMRLPHRVVRVILPLLNKQELAFTENSPMEFGSLTLSKGILIGPLSRGYLLWQ